MVSLQFSNFLIVQMFASWPCRTRVISLLFSILLLSCDEAGMTQAQVRHVCPEIMALSYSLPPSRKHWLCMWKCILVTLVDHMSLDDTLPNSHACKIGTIDLREV